MKIKEARHIIALVLRLTRKAGITLPWAIYLLPDYMEDQGLIKHELVHVAQIKRMGMVKFYLTYLAQWLRYGYHDMPLEREARGEI